MQPIAGMRKDLCIFMQREIVFLRKEGEEFTSNF